MKPRRDEGNAALELIMLAPALLLMVAVIVGAGRVISTKSALEAVAREAGRMASEAPDADSAREAAGERAETVAVGMGLDLHRLDAATETGSFERGTPVAVRVRYRVSLEDLPAFGFLPGSFEVSARHVEMVARYRSR